MTNIYFVLWGAISFSGVWYFFSFKIAVIIQLVFAFKHSLNFRILEDIMQQQVPIVEHITDKVNSIG
jgi:hypothetical protein